MNVENGARVLADTELFGRYYEGSDAVDYLSGLGFSTVDRRVARHQLQWRFFLWSFFGFCVRAAFAALFATL